MYDTATKAQFIDLRARGWSYDKIVRHTGISKSTLLTWGREYAADIETLKADYISPRAAFPDGTAQESYFHNLEGALTDNDESTGKAPKARKQKKPKNTNSFRSGIGKVRRGFRKFMRLPAVRAAFRYAVFKH
jgi:hypothetical protein